MTQSPFTAKRAVMLDIRPVGYVIGLLVTVLGAAMMLPLIADAIEGRAPLGTFGISGMVTAMTGAMVVLACADERQQGLTLQQTFLLTTGTWFVLPLFGALPFWIGAPDASYTDAFFEAMSGLTTTGATVFSGLDDLPAGTLLWRALLQWFGGVGIIVVALAFLPSLKVGGMQIFRSEGFDTFGKILPRAAEIAASVSWIYLGVTLACLLGYTWAGMSGFEALLHALTTVSTGGFSSHDDSIGYYSGNVEYVAVIFMLIASLPFVRFVQLVAGTAQPLFHDSQIRSYLLVIAIVVAGLTLYVRFDVGEGWEVAFRQVLFNTVSIISGTGYAS
ncbi:MAG: potassium transporter TrkG, partial [Pseudomonadota bacterium]